MSALQIALQGEWCLVDDRTDAQSNPSTTCVLCASSAVNQPDHRHAQDSGDAPPDAEQGEDAPRPFLQPRTDFSVAYNLADDGGLGGVVPAIIVGNVFALAREEYALPTCQDTSLPIVSCLHGKLSPGRCF